MESSAIPANPSPQLKAVLQWIDGFNAWDIDKVLLPTTDDYIHYVLPASLNRPVRAKKEYREDFMSYIPMLTDFKATILEIIEGLGRVFLHVKSSAMSTTGVPYNNEYNITFHLVEQADGSYKISVVKEFVDSKFSDSFFPAERERQLKKASETTT